MHKYSLKAASLMVGVLAATLSFTACGDEDDDDAPDAPSVTISAPRPTKLTYYNNALISISYDSKGRMTQFSTGDSYGDIRRVEVSYSPFKYVEKEYDGNEVYATMTISDATFNSQGYITKAKITEVYEGDRDTYSATIGYDSEGHWTSVTADGEKQNITWSDGNLVNYGGEVLYSYSTEKNTAKNVCVMAFGGITAEFWLTGMFGEVPANFPSKVVFVYDGDSATFAYTLNSDGSIKSETSTSNGSAFGVDYVYGSRSVDSNFGLPTGEVKALDAKKRNMNPFHRLRK